MSRCSREHVRFDLMSFFFSLSAFPVVPLRTSSCCHPHHHHLTDKKELLLTMSSLSRPVVSPECFYGVLIHRVFLSSSSKYVPFRFVDVSEHVQFKFWKLSSRSSFLVLLPWLSSLVHSCKKSTWIFDVLSMNFILENLIFVLFHFGLCHYCGQWILIGRISWNMNACNLKHCFVDLWSAITEILLLLCAKTAAVKILIL